MNKEIKELTACQALEVQKATWVYHKSEEEDLKDIQEE